MSGLGRGWKAYQMMNFGFQKWVRYCRERLGDTLSLSLRFAIADGYKPESHLEIIWGC